MELFRTGEVLLRPPLLPFLMPAAYRLPQSSRAATAPIARRYQRHCQTSRSFSATHTPSEQATAAARQARDSSPPSRDFPSTTPSRSTIDDDLASLLDNTLDFKKGNPAAPSSRTSHFSSRYAQATNPRSRGQVKELGAGRSSNSVVDDLLSGIGRSRNNQQNRAPRSESSIGQMLDPLGYMSRQTNRTSEVDDRPVMKLGPKVGRTVQVNAARNMDVGRAFRTLDAKCARNSVRRDFNKQRFHERPGLKRKRLKSERWRRNFKNQFRATVRMVQKMKSQGW